MLPAGPSGPNLLGSVPRSLLRAETAWEIRTSNEHLCLHSTHTQSVSAGELGRLDQLLSQPRHCWQLGPDTSLFRGEGDSVHYRIVSSNPGHYPRDVSSTHPSHPPKLWQQEMPPDIASCLLGDKKSLVKNDCPSCQPGHGAPALNPGGPEFTLCSGTD